jgi:2-polyprenyl-3-methyl-5-hydroxy-6-metoxy-1,4-benzoquinol methylase
MASILDDRGYNQGFHLTESTRIRMERRARSIAAEFDKQTPGRVLEIGCGTGELSYWIARDTTHSVIATDRCLPFIEHARANYTLPNLRYELLDISQPPDEFLGGFDYVVGNGILHHLYYFLDDALQWIRSMLTPSGKIVFLEPNLYNPYIFAIFKYARTWANLEPDEMAFSRRYIEHVLQEQGFNHISVRYSDFLVPGIPRSFVTPVCVAGDVLEKIYPLNRLSQSLFISAQV